MAILTLYLTKCKWRFSRKNIKTITFFRNFQQIFGGFYRRFRSHGIYISLLCVHNFNYFTFASSTYLSHAQNS